METATTKTHAVSALKLFGKSRKPKMTWEEKQQYNAITMLSNSARQMVKRKVPLKDRLQKAKNVLKQSDELVECIANLPLIIQNSFNSHVRVMGQSKFHKKYSLDDTIVALALQKQNPRVYRCLSNVFLLPRIKTLRKLINRVNLNPGICDFIFNNIFKVYDCRVRDNEYCVLSFDEMKLTRELRYNNKFDLVEGFVDSGFDRNNDIADHAMVWMVRGIYGKKPWKQTVAYTFCKGTTPWRSIVRTFEAIVRKCNDFGLEIVASVCDQSPTNVRAVKELLSNTQRRCCFTANQGFIMVDNQKLVPMFDPPSLLKSLTKLLSIQDLRYSIDGINRVAKWSHIEDAYFIDRCNGEFKSFLKLTDQHMIPDKIKKMHVGHCAKVFSHKVGSLIYFLSRVQAQSACKSWKMPSAGIDTAALVVQVDNLFDSVNSKEISQPDISLWDRCIQMFNSMHFIDRETGDKVHPNVLKNWVHTLESFKILSVYLKDLRFEDFRSRHFNKDPLRNFFYRIRRCGRNVTPTCSLFVEHLKSLLINAYIVNSDLYCRHKRRNSCNKVNFDEILLDMKEIFISTSRDKNYYSSLSSNVLVVVAKEIALKNYYANTVNLSPLEFSMQACTECSQALQSQRDAVMCCMREVDTIAEYIFDNFPSRIGIKGHIKSNVISLVDVIQTKCPQKHLKHYLIDTYLLICLKKRISTVNKICVHLKAPIIEMHGLPERQDAFQT